MSNIYIQEPPALGKVLLKTSAGKIDIELWTKEAPKACRNFIQLCMEGYYKGTIFHRVVPDFIVQGGDPNGNGTGGESVYGGTFKDEFHSRLRFNRRGLVAMANAGKDDNGSQFFFTLAATPELQNKHTIFGKVTGDTIYNVLKLAEGEIDAEERPDHPHRITDAEVLINPFTDIVPRFVEKKMDEQPKKKKKEAVAIKNLGLLSFGEEIEEDETEAVGYRGKPKSTHDLLEDPKLSKKTAAELEEELELNVEQESIQKIGETAETVNNIREKLKSKKPESTVERDDSKKLKERERDDDSSDGEYYLGKERDKQRKKERERVQGEIKLLKKEMKTSKSHKVDRDSAMQEETSRKDNSTAKKSTGKDDYTPDVEKYMKRKEKLPNKGQAREDFTLSLLAKFKNKLSAIKDKAQTQTGDPEQDKVQAEANENVDEVIHTDEWLGHKLRFEDKGAVLAKDASTKGDDWFDIYDPRNPINKRKREESDKKMKKIAKK